MRRLGSRPAAKQYVDADSEIDQRNQAQAQIDGFIYRGKNHLGGYAHAIAIKLILRFLPHAASVELPFKMRRILQGLVRDSQEVVANFDSSSIRGPVRHNALGPEYAAPGHPVFRLSFTVRDQLYRNGTSGAARLAVVIAADLVMRNGPCANFVPLLPEVVIRRNSMAIYAQDTVTGLDSRSFGRTACWNVVNLDRAGFDPQRAILRNRELPFLAEIDAGKDHRRDRHKGQDQR